MPEWAETNSTSTTRPPLGVGLLFQPQLRDFVVQQAASFDYLELVPDTLWTDMGPKTSPRYVESSDLVEWVASQGKPMVLHSIGMSIGSAHRLDLEHVAQLARWQARFDAPWVSDHLAWHLADHGDVEVNVNLTLPVALDRATLDLLTERVRLVQDRVQAPFLLENNVYYFDAGPADFDEPTFLNELADRTGLGFLLDLHNLHVNVVNRGVDAHDYLDRLDLRRVVEIHVAGGYEYEGFRVDAHSGAVPEPVWELLDHVVPRCPDLGGVTFELFGTWYDTLGEHGLAEQLALARAGLRRPVDAVEGAR